ncbi:sugar ABC transporter substrate-binding protein [Geodermatophilus sp. URMC 64]
MFGSTNRGARGIVAVSSAVLLSLLAACGSDDAGGSGGSSGETDDAAVAAAQERLDPYLTPADDIEVDVPLTQKPEEGQRVAIVRYNNPAAEDFARNYADPGEALGWDVDIYAVEGTDPQAISNGVLRAVSEDVDYIVVQGSSLQAIGPSLEAAKEAGIPVFLAAGVGEPEGEANGLYGNTMGENTVLGNLAMADQVIVDSGGTGTVLHVNAPDFPTLAPIDDALAERIADECPQCTLETLGISAADLGGDIASNIVAAIRQHPDVKYVIAAFPDLARGLPQALAAAGLDDVQIYLSLPDEASVALVESGDYDAAILTPRESFAWALFDQIARVSVGMDPLPEEHGTLNMQLWTTEDMPKGETTWDPPDFQEKYKELWQVS